jgi:phage terminase large subunit GpA-like protein
VVGWHVRQNRPHKGFPKATWEKDPSRNNEALDCRVYARAAASIYGLDRMSDYRWRRMEEALGMKANVPKRGVEIPVTEETRAKPSEPVKPKSRFTQRKTVKSDDPYL